MRALKRVDEHAIPDACRALYSQKAFGHHPANERWANESKI
jgi:hypothetical protein